MNITLENLLKSEAPIFYGILNKKDIELDQRYPLAVFGIEVDDGWFEIVRSASQAIEAFNKQGANIVCHQIKEKFGGLRIYTSSTTAEFYDKLDSIIQYASDRADMTCERCGIVGKLRSGPWLMTLCDRCHEDRVERLKNE